jgi:hypothetical protein
MTKMGTMDVGMDMDTRRTLTPSLGTVIATTKITGTLRVTPIIHGMRSITGGITTMMNGASIIGDIVGMTAMIGRAAAAGIIAADRR